RVVGDVAQRGAVAHEYGAGADRLEERLVEVDRDRVRVFDAAEQVVVAGDQQPAPVGGVHVHPHAVARAQVGDLRQGVDAAEVGGTGGGDHGHGQEPPGFAAPELGGQGVGAHTAAVVTRHGDHRLVPQTEECGRLGDTEVPGLGGQDAHPRDEVGQACVLVLALMHLVSGKQQRLEVGLAAAAGEDP